MQRKKKPIKGDKTSRNTMSISTSNNLSQSVNYIQVFYLFRQKGFYLPYLPSLYNHIITGLAI